MNIAILMSTYNGEKYLREQIDSILNQLGNFSLDLWVRDDGSKDGTLHILEEYALEGKLRWYSGENLGPALSFLDLVKHCPGYDYYAFADQDDYWMPEKINEGLLVLQDKQVPALYSANLILVDEELNDFGRNVYRTTPKLDFETLLCATGLTGCTMLFNNLLAKVIQDHELPQKIIMHDSFLPEVCLLVGGEIFFDPRAHMKYRQHEKNVLGVPHGFVMTLKRRIKDILSYDKVGIAGDAEALKQYIVDANNKKVAWIDRVSSYRESLFKRVMLAFSMRTHYVSLNMAITIRLKILLGNR